MALNPPPEQKPKLMTDEFDTKSQKKQKHPEGLKGKEIGMHYAKKGKNNQNSNKKTPMSEWVSQGMPQGSTNSSESKQSKQS